MLIGTCEKVFSRPRASAVGCYDELHRIRKAKNDMTTGRANHGKEWTEQEIALIWDANCLEKLEEVALQLGRSIAAVRTARYQFASRRPNTRFGNVS